MPLHPNALAMIRTNLEAIAKGERAPLIVVGQLTDVQLAALNAHRLQKVAGHTPVTAEVVFVGRHVYNSRILGDGYTIEDVLDQIANAMRPESVFDGGLPMQILKSPTTRADRYGNTQVRDTVVFECKARQPRPELFSVIPKGDRIRPKQKGHP